ncbi:MAG TPA: AAA family ATPase [Gaiellaceae bacterium]
MADKIKTLVALDSGVGREFVDASLPRDGIDVVGIVEGLDESWLTLQETANDLLIVACSGHSERTLFLIDAAVRQRPTRPVVVFSYGSPTGFVRRVFDVGADDVIMLPEDPEKVRFALEKAVARKNGGGSSPLSQGKIVAVLGPKGGTGKTLTSTNLAVALAELDQRVILVDLDLQFGDVGLGLGLSPEATIYDLVKAGGSLDEEKLGAYLTEHSSGVRALLAPSRPDHASSVTVEFLREVYGALRRMSDYIIVDTPPGFTPEVIATIDVASTIAMVGTLDSLSLKNTKLGLETLDLMGFPPDRVRLVLNRANSRVGITDEDVLSIIGRSPDVFIPSDREIPRAVNEGKPIVSAKSSSDAAKGFRKLAESLLEADAAVAAPEAQKQHGFRRLLARSA